MTLAALDAQLATRTEIAAARERIYSGRVFGADLQLESQRLVLLTAKLLELEEAAQSKAPPPNPEFAKLPAEEAGKRAAAIRDRPEYWRPDSTFDKDGARVITREAHQALVREHHELVSRATEVKEPSP